MPRMIRLVIVNVAATALLFCQKVLFKAWEVGVASEMDAVGVKVELGILKVVAGAIIGATIEVGNNSDEVLVLEVLLEI